MFVHLSPPSPFSVPSEQQLRVVFALQVFVDEVREELLEDARGVLHLPLQRRHDERGHVAPVSHGEGPLRLQGTDEGQQEVLFGQQLAEQRQGFFHIGRNLRGKRWWWEGRGSGKEEEVGWREGVNVVQKRQETTERMKQKKR